MTEGTAKQLGFNTNGGYDTGTETFNDGPVPLSEAEMAEHGILDAHRAMTEAAAEKESDTLELAADLVQGQQDTDCLNWLIANGADIQNQNGYNQLSIDPDCNPDLVGSQEGIRAAIDKRLAEWCPTMNRPKRHCNCPDCGSSLVQIGN